MEQTGKWIIALGIVIIAIGLIVYFFGNKFSWFGNLPGDIKIEKENIKIYFPLMSMIILSVVISILIYLFNKFFK
ncbi:MAG: DUF2905 domain-containing protein [Bacteroidetes bacterium]|nr:MAG: DUF2905 domain-containing protein [Bacteroidota bacterium]REK03457.1 MAG: DUF2905 domain-containing protein [Bacteroidota bacterium]REK34762.1 MAG: DUF2905 domain-containing protein [Bacteroidota bacterium]REK51360.1 MAG: DUF2905 domain-containing protein [Bacteroidota bacterium]